MRDLFLAIHLIGIVTWFGTAIPELVLLGQAKQSADYRLREWAYRVYARMLKPELVGLVLLLIGGVGLLASGGWVLLSSAWFLVKMAAVVVLVVQRLYVFNFFRKTFGAGAPPLVSGDSPAGLETAVASFDRFSKLTAPLSAVALLVVIVMVFFRPI